MRVAIVADNTLPLNTQAFARFMNAASSTIVCEAIRLPIRLDRDSVALSEEIEKMSLSDLFSLKEFDLSIICTNIPFWNNFYYEGIDGIFIISFSQWHLCSSLPVTNGLAFMIVQIISKYYVHVDGTHDENTGCLHDFMWDKSYIDTSMRAAFICDQCAMSRDDNLDPAIDMDIAGLLDIISNASRKNKDILDDDRIIPLARRDTALKYDVFLCHNSEDKADVRKLNSALKAGGLRTWFDEDDLEPGSIWQDELELQIEQIAACLVIVGDSGLGPWHKTELRSFIQEFLTRGCKIIPVIIGSEGTVPKLPIFLRQFLFSDLRGNGHRSVARIIEVLKKQQVG